jgi:predicted transcriptional regulator
VSSVDSLQEALAYVLACVLNDTTLSSKELAMAARTAASTLIANIKGHFDAQTAALQQQYSEIQQKAASLEDVITVQRHRVEKLSIFTGFLRQHKQTVPTYSPIELTRSESDTDSLFGLLG